MLSLKIFKIFNILNILTNYIIQYNRKIQIYEERTAIYQYLNSFISGMQLYDLNKNQTNYKIKKIILKIIGINQQVYIYLFFRNLDKNKVFPCCKCEKVFNNIHKRSAHMNKHTN